MSAEQERSDMIAAFRDAGLDMTQELERRLELLRRADISGWYYVVTIGATTSDGRPTATVKPKNEAVSSANPEIGSLPCLRGYTPVVGQRVLVRWIAGNRADGVIEG